MTPTTETLTDAPAVGRVIVAIWTGPFRDVAEPIDPPVTVTSRERDELVVAGPDGAVEVWSADAAVNWEVTV